MIDEILDSVEYCTLALCRGNKPYSLPINFVRLDGFIYFHGSKKGRKMDILKNNLFASFSAVMPYSMIQSYFSSSKNLACPATQFFKSVIIDGEIEFVVNYKEKVRALSALMKKLQKEGGYKPLNEEIYKKAINSTTIYKLKPKSTDIKLKFGQHLSQERFDMIIEHLEKRGNAKDISTIEMMKRYKN